MRRKSIFVLLGLLLAFTVACTNKKSVNPLANVGSKQPDKVLFDRAMDAMKHNRFDVARMTLQTLINTYPDSEFIARAKLAVADSWYAEGGTTALQQAEIEYKDFRTFFPNMPEAAEAQLKVANIHYEQMEKPDRDYTHAMRAEEEYRALIQEYPDSKLVPQAKQRLREVQEVLADREFGIGKFYFSRLAYPAAIARLKTLVDRYPLYSGADQALYLLGQSYEAEINTVRKNPRGGEVVKARMIDDLTKDAAAAYAFYGEQVASADWNQERAWHLSGTRRRPTRRSLRAIQRWTGRWTPRRGWRPCINRCRGLREPPSNRTRRKWPAGMKRARSRTCWGTSRSIPTWHWPRIMASRRWWIPRRPIREMWWERLQPRPWEGRQVTRKSEW